MVESLLGGLLGGVFRIVPEFLKIWDAKDSRKHELAMLDKEMDFAKLRAEQAMHTVDAEVDKAHLEALGSALDGQAKMAVAGGKVAAFLSALVRPLVTYWFVVLYSSVKIAMMIVAYEQSADWKAVLIESWNPEDMGIFSGIITFWFVSRSFDRK
jgi:hypothetical protein